MLSQQPTARTLAGYRLVRKLGDGARSEVFLGVPVSGRIHESSDESSGHSVVLKVFRSRIDRGDVGTELAALAAADLAHCVRLIDVATADDGLPVPILARVKRGSVASLLRDRDSIDSGEAVTLLAPIAATVTALHRRGVAHSNLGVASVHLGAGGEPVLLGFGHSAIFDAGLSAAALDNEAAVNADRDSLADLAGVVLAHVRRGSGEQAVRQLQIWLDDSHGDRRFEFAGELEDRLFNLADPRPVSFAQLPGASAAVPSRIGLAAPTTIPEREAAAGGPRHGNRRSGSHAAEVRGSALIGVVTNAVLNDPLAAAKARVLALVRGVRKPLWVVAGAIAVSLVLALTLLPAGAHSPVVTVARHTPQPAVTQSRAPIPNDPLLAVAPLLKVRNECIRERSIACLGFAEEESSEAISTDTSLIQRVRRGGELPSPIDASEPRLTERLGDSALIDLDPQRGPASALLIRGEAGWRIRSFETGKPVQP